VIRAHRSALVHGRVAAHQRRARSVGGRAEFGGCSADSVFLQAIDLARSQHALSWELCAAASFARLERDQDRSGKGYELVTAVYDRFTEGFGTADQVSAKTLLDGLR